MVYIRDKYIQSNMPHLSEKVWWMITFREQLIFPTQLMKMNKYRLSLRIIFLYWMQDSLTRYPPCLKMEISQNLWYSQNTTPPGVGRMESDLALGRGPPTQYANRRCLMELYTWNLYGFMKQCHPNKLNKKEKNLFWIFDQN